MTRPNDTDQPDVQPRSQPCAPDRLLSGLGSAAEQHYQLELYKGIRFLQHRWQSNSDTHSQGVGAELATSTRASTLTDHPISQKWLRMLQARQAQAHYELQQALPGQAHAAPAVSILAGFTAYDQSASLSSPVLATIELVDRLFDCLRTDENLPDPSKRLLSYLHAPVLKVALIEPHFFERAEHPARMLLNSLTEASARWVSHDGRSEYDMYGRTNAIVLRLLAEFTHDVSLFADVLMDFSSDVENLARRQALLERRALDKAQGEEKLRAAKRRAYAEVQQRTQARELPSTVLLLLLQPWSEYLSFILLRSGDTSNAWREALQVIDDLLHSLEPMQHSLEPQQHSLEPQQHSLEPTQHTPEPKQLASGQLGAGDKLLPILERGLAAIGYEPAKGRTLLDAIQSLQAMVQQGREVAPAPASMRHKLEAMVAERAGIDTHAHGALTPAEQDELESLQLQGIELGAWLDTADGQRLRIAWQSPGALHYLLLDQRGCKVALVSAVQLARDLLAGKATITHRSTKPFFERALENIYQQMNAHIAAHAGGGRER